MTRLTNQPLDLASILHVVNFAIIGYAIPDQYLLAISLGILWEVFETLVTNHPTVRSYLRRYVPDYSHLWDETRENKHWDLVFNLLGYTLGTYVARR